jgi:hypothetical protein
MERPIPSACPSCGDRLALERLRCPTCSTAVEGRFTLDWPGRLTADQLAFAKVFLEQRGKIKDVEQVLGLSYPTVVARLDQLVEAIGGAPAKSEDALSVLERLAAGELDVDEAEALLRRRKK